MEKFTMNMIYGYKGSSNCTLQSGLYSGFTESRYVRLNEPISVGNGL